MTPPSPASAPIAIVGAGIAGLSAALFLARAGYDVRVFERAPRLEAAGAGLQLSPNALRVLGRLGFVTRLAAAGVPASSVTLRSARGGRALAHIPVASPDGTGYLAVHRADLQAGLLQAVEDEARVRVELGRRLDHVETTADGAILRLRDEAGGISEERCAFLVGADGAHSAVAASLGLPAAAHTGIVAARFLAPNDGSFERIEAWLGRRRHAVAYPIRGGREVNLVLIAPQGEADPTGGFSRWDPRLRETVARAQFQGVWPLLEADRPLLPAPGIVLLGDAAHAMLPFAAQGAAMAIEDACVLADRLASTPDRASALSRFEAERAPRLKAVRARVRFHRFTYHLPFPLSLGRDLALALRSPAALRRDLAWLYDWTPDHGKAL